MRKLFLAFVISSAIITLNSCGSDSGTDESNTGGDTTAVKEDTGSVAQKIFYSIPSPIELAQLIQKAGASYNKDLLNDIDNAAKYSSVNSKAINLGVYGSDLSYTSIFDQTQESILYLRCAKKLADGLGISGAFTENTVDRMQANYGNQDSLLNIISDSYYTTDEYLKENQRENTSALVIAGGWIEGLYIGTQLVRSTKDNSGIITRIAEMKGSLANLIALLESYKSEEGAAEILSSLKAIQSVYDEMKISDSKPEVKTDAKTRTTTIGGTSSYSLTTEQLNKITKLAEELRAKIIKV